MKIIPSIVTLLFLIAAGTVSSPAQNATTVEPLLVYKALQDKDCRHWVDSVMDKLSFKEKVGQLFIYTIAPVDTKRNLELLREVIDTYKVGGLLFSGGKMQNQVELTNRAQRQAKVPLMITFDGEWGLAMRLRGMPVFPRNMVLGCIRDNKLLYEYSCSVFTEVVFGTTFWDYSHMPFNINGRINLLFCFFWGVLAIVWLKLLYPAVSRVIEKIPPVAGKVLTYILVFAMALDMLISSVALMRYVDRKQQAGADTAVEQFLDHTYPDSFIEWVYPNMKITD